MAAEHVASHHRGSDVGERLLDDPRALVDLSAFEAMHRTKDRERNHPLVQTLAADPERVVDSLAGAGDEAVERHRDPETQLGHFLSPDFGRRRPHFERPSNAVIREIPRTARRAREPRILITAPGMTA